VLEAVSANGNSERRPAEERRSDIRFFVFALLFYLLSVLLFAAVPLLAMPLESAIFDRYYLPTIEKAIEEEYRKPARTEEPPRATHDARAEAGRDTTKDDREHANGENED